MRLEERLLASERWAAAFSSFVDQKFRESVACADELNKRLVFLETDNKEIVPRKREDDNDDPFTGSRSWISQAAAAERAAGVRSPVA